jgi:hypothetical protein
MKRYQDAERLGRWGRVRTGLGRILESEDDELAYAYYAANDATGAPYDRRSNSRAYARRSYAVYRPRHVERGIAMVLKAVGLKANGRLHRVLWSLASRLMQMRAASLARAGA